MKYLQTSRFHLSGDRKLSYLDSIKWFYNCYLNNLNPLNDIDNRINFKRVNEVFDCNLDCIELYSSPSRAMCEMLLRTLNFDDFKNFVGNKIRVLEVGCGSGVYGLKLNEILGDAMQSYHGVDIVRNTKWEGFNLDTKFKFTVGDASHITEYLNGVNFIFTQSALEHFPEDLRYFAQVRDYVDSVNHPIFQIHFLPSAACLRTYLLHGFRQYTPRSISMFTKLYSNNSTFELYSLGGRRLNNLHFLFITLPWLVFRSDLRKHLGKWYMYYLRVLIKRDFKNWSDNSPAFYALVIKSNFKN